MIACLIIHGYTGSPYEVLPLTTYLRKNTKWKIIVPTLPGHGSELHLEGASHEEWLKESENTLRQLKKVYNKIYLIGFSMGGMIAAYLAGKYKVDKLVLLAPARKVLSFKQITIDVGDVIVDGIKGDLDNNQLYLRYKDKIGSVPMKANIEFLRLVKYTRGYLKEIESPVFIAQGQQDGLVRAKAIHYLDKEITSKQKEIVLFEQSDHLICWGKDRDILSKMIYNFLAD